MFARIETALLFAALSGCAMTSTQRNAPPMQRSADSVVRDAGGAQVARAVAIGAGDVIRIRIDVSRMPAGSYGAHLHTTGRCEGPDFATAGPHWNPTGRQHGKNNPNGMHKGDLPNLLVGADGRGSLEFTIPGAALANGPMPLLDGDGAAIVIHQAADDYRTDPSGNSGPRIACGVFS
jgi:Cu-Zn family superoxide dismutase